MWDVILDAFLDSLKIFPFLILLYILIEVIEEKVSTGTKFFKYTQGKYATLVGAGLGLIPQCGFSVVASDLYARRYIKVGTLLAIFIATSDEAIPIILSNPANAYLIFPILLIKFIFAISVGYAVDGVLRKYYKKNPLIAGKLSDISSVHHKHDEHDHDEKHEHNDGKETKRKGVVGKKIVVADASIVEGSKQISDEKINGVEIEVDGCCGHNIEGKRSTLKQFFIHPLIHSLKIFAYIFIINLILGLILFYVGEENVVGFMQSFVWIQPVLVCLIGLIPNCASSVLITQLMVINGINFGAGVAGLCVNAGIGLAVLFKENKNIKQNFLILSILVGSSIVLGYIIMALGFLF